jgi:hypothetical protein
MHGVLHCHFKTEVLFFEPSNMDLHGVYPDTNWAFLVSFLACPMHSLQPKLLVRSLRFCPARERSLMSAPVKEVEIHEPILALHKPTRNAMDLRIDAQGSTA